MIIYWNPHCVHISWKSHQSSMKYCHNIDKETYDQEDCDIWFCCSVLTFMKCSVSLAFYFLSPVCFLSPGIVICLFFRQNILSSRLKDTPWIFIYFFFFHPWFPCRNSRWAASGGSLYMMLPIKINMRRVTWQQPGVTYKLVQNNGISRQAFNRIERTTISEGCDTRELLCVCLHSMCDWQ